MSVDWTAVDWTLTNVAIARQTGATRQAVSRARARHSDIPAPPRPREHPDTFGGRVAARREALGLSRAHLEALLSLKPRGLEGLEQRSAWGRDPVALARLARELRTDVETLAGLDTGHPVIEAVLRTLGDLEAAGDEDGAAVLGEALRELCAACMFASALIGYRSAGESAARTEKKMAEAIAAARERLER